MKFTLSVLSSILVATVSASPAIDPLTVTSLSPSQSAAIVSAELSYFSSVATDPVYTSLFMAIATDTSVIAALNSAVGAMTAVPTGKDQVDQYKSLIGQLPSPASSFLNSVYNQGLAIESSVLNSGAVATGAAKSSSQSTATGSGAAGIASASGSAAPQTVSGSGAAPTNAVIKVAGVAIGVFGAAVAVL